MANDKHSAEADWMLPTETSTQPPFTMRTDSSGKLWLDTTDEMGRLQSLCLGAKAEALHILADAMAREGFRTGR